MRNRKILRKASKGMKSQNLNRSTLLLAIVVGLLSATAVRSEQFGQFTYSAGATSVVITDYPTDAVGPVVIPSEITGKPVTRIRYNAFRNCTGITSVTLPDSVYDIGSSAFDGCHNLVSINIPSIVTYIGSGAFDECRALTSITLPPGITSIGDRTFQNCASLTTLPLSEHVTSIGASAFNSCHSLTNVVIPASVTRLGRLSFAYCRNLQSVSIPASISEIGDWAFNYCEALTEVEIMNGVSSIGERAFNNCSTLPTIDIPESINEIGIGAFHRCEALADVTIPSNVVSIERHVFAFCRELRGVTLPSGVMTIADSAFTFSGLSSVVFPASIVSVGERAFEHCADLSAAVFLGNAPETVAATAFSRNAFDFRVYYLSGSTGFADPPWTSDPAIMIDPVLFPAAVWLLSHGFPFDADLHQDHNGDGVTLFVAYALNLDPANSVLTCLPVPRLQGENLVLTFHAASPGVIYRAETSTDLLNWQSEGVTLSNVDAAGMRCASVVRDTPTRFLRLIMDAE